MLDIHELINNEIGELRFQISDSVFNEIEPALIEFEEKFGYKIDRYSDCKLTSNIGDLAKCIRDLRSTKPSDGVIKMANCLQKMQEEGTKVIFVGD